MDDFADRVIRSNYAIDRARLRSSHTVGAHGLAGTRRSDRATQLARPLLRDGYRCGGGINRAGQPTQPVTSRITSVPALVKMHTVPVDDSCVIALLARTTPAPALLTLLAVGRVPHG